VSILHHLAQAAAVILLVELLVVLMMVLGVAGGLAFGLHWTRGKSGWAFEKANGYLPLLTKYSRVGTDLAAKPFILGAGASTRVRVTLESIRRQVRENRESPGTGGTPVVASRPIEPDATIVIPALSDPTIVTLAVPEAATRT
jgi:hypothetical protein